MTIEWLLIKCRSLLRKVHLPGRIDSFPFISGDAYRFRCDLDLTTSDFLDIYDHDIESFRSVFLPVGKFDSFVQFLPKQQLKFPRWNLIIHNGDLDPQFSDMQTLSSYFGKVFSVNWTGPRHIAMPIPIGLENRILRRNGIPWEYKFLRWRYKNSERSNLLLVAFKSENNLRERGQLAERFREFPGVLCLTEFIAPFKYKKIVTHSKFVLSPPGNGIDCHRTWEAIYLNSRPIVLSRAWPFLSEESPALAVQDWSELDLENLQTSNTKTFHPNEIWTTFMTLPFEENSI